MSSNYKHFTSDISNGTISKDHTVVLKADSTFSERSEKLSNHIANNAALGPGSRLPAIILKTEKISVEEIPPSHILALKTLKLTQKSEESGTSRSITVNKHFAVVSGQSYYFDPTSTPAELMTVVYEIASKDDESTDSQINRKCEVEILGKNYGILRNLNSAGLPFVAADSPKIVSPEDKKAKKEEFDKNKSESLEKAKKIQGELSPGTSRTKSEEVELFEKYSGDKSGNPRNIDIVTEVIQGVQTTMSRKAMPKLKLFFKLMEDRIKELKKLGEGDIDLPKPSYGESFRISVKHATPRNTPGGKFRSGRHNSIHNWGNACDITLPAKYQAYTRTGEDYRMNYVSLFVHCAQVAGFKRIGIGQVFIHVDTAEQGSTTRNPIWWVYPKANTSVSAKRGYIKNRWISANWPVASSSNPPLDLTGLDYKKLIYTKQGKTREGVQSGV